MLFANVAAFSAAADEPQQAVLSYIESTECKASDGGGTYNKLYPLDGNFSTDFKSAAVVGGFYTVALDGEYELTTMKIYQNYGYDTIAGNRHWYARLNKVYVSNDGVDFTEVTEVEITATSWLIEQPETNNITLARVDYTFPEGTKAKYIKVTNDLAEAKEFRLTEMFVYGVKTPEPPLAPTLVSLVAESGTLSPSFSSNVTEYTLSVGSLEGVLPAISVTQASGCSVDIVQASSENNYVATITVYQTTDITNKKVYKVTYQEVNIPDEIPLSFHASSAETTSDSGGSYSTLWALDGDFETRCKIKQGAGNHYDVRLGDGNTDYELTEIRLYQHSGLSETYKKRYNTVYVSNDGINFAKVTEVDYSVSGWISTEEVNFKENARHTYTFPEGITARYVRIGNDMTTGNEMAIMELKAWGETEYDVVPLAYKIDASDGVLSPEFSINTTEYDLTIPQNPAENTPTISVAVGGKCDAEITQPSSENNYVGTILVFEKGNRANSKEYKVNVKEAPSITPKLSDITSASGTLSPAFSESIYEYTLTVPSFDTMPTVSAVAADGCSFSVSQPYPVNGMTAEITAYQTVKPNNKKTYTVKVVSERDTYALKLAYADSTKCKGADTGGSYDNRYPLDGDFASSFKSISAIGGYYTIMLDATYEITTMKIYQDYGQMDGNWIYRLNKVEVSDDGVNFKAVDGVSVVCRTGWIQNTPETNGNTLARIDYLFPDGVKARYVKITSDYAGATETRLSEAFIWGKELSGFDETALKQMDSSYGVISPAFNKDVLEYAFYADSFEKDKLPQFVAKSARSGDLVEIIQPSAENCYTGTFKVTNKEDLSDSKTYKVRLTVKSSEKSNLYITDQNLNEIRKNINVLKCGTYLFEDKLYDVTWSADSENVDLSTGLVTKTDNIQTVKITASLKEAGNPQNTMQKVFTLKITANDIKSPVEIIKDDFSLASDGVNAEKVGDKLVLSGEALYASNIMLAQNIKIGEEMLFDFTVEKAENADAGVTFMSGDQLGFKILWNDDGYEINWGESKKTTVKTASDTIKFRLELLGNKFNVLADDGNGYYDCIMLDATYTQMPENGFDRAIFTSIGTGKTEISDVKASISKQKICNIIADSLSFEKLSDEKPFEISKKINLIKDIADGVTISWESSDDTVLNSASGEVTPQSEGKYVTLTAKVSYQDLSTERKYHILVGGENLAKGASVNATAANIGTSYEANAVDLSADSLYIVQGSEPYDVTLTLKNKQMISHIDIFPAETDSSIEEYTIYVSDDGKKYEAVYEGKSLTEMQSAAISLCEVKFVRLSVTKVTGAETGIAEILVFYAPTAEQLAEADIKAIEWPSEWEDEFSLPINGKNGSVFTYTCNLKEASFDKNGDEIIASIDGVKYDTTAEIKVTAEKDGKTANKSFNIKVKGSYESSSGSSGGGSSGSSGGGGGSSMLGVSFGTPQNAQNTQKANPILEEIASSWASEEISYLYNRGIVNGDGESLKLEGSVTRAEFVAMLLRAKEIPVISYSGAFSDVDSSAWYANYIETAKNEGLIDGFDGKVRPNDCITREEMAKILVKMNDISERSDITFGDVGEISEWAYEFVEKAFAMGLINGYEDNTFRPQNNLKRVEAMVVIYRMLKASQA